MLFFFLRKPTNNIALPLHCAFNPGSGFTSSDFKRLSSFTGIPPRFLAVSDQTFPELSARTKGPTESPCCLFSPIFLSFISLYTVFFQFLPVVEPPLLAPILRRVSPFLPPISGFLAKLTVLVRLSANLYLQLVLSFLAPSSLFPLWLSFSFGLIVVFTFLCFKPLIFFLTFQQPPPIPLQTGL